jgi:hypothetical protein
MADSLPYSRNPDSAASVEPNTELFAVSHHSKSFSPVSFDFRQKRERQARGLPFQIHDGRLS